MQENDKILQSDTQGTAIMSFNIVPTVSEIGTCDLLNILPIG